MSRVHIHPRDYVLIVALLAMTLLVCIKWDEYTSCQDPLNVWLVVNFFSFIIFRCMQFAFQYFSADSRRRPFNRFMTKLCAVLNLWVVYPFMWVWCILGSVWFSRSKECLPESTQSWWFVAWLIYSYVYLLAFGFLIYSTYRLRRFDNQLRSIERIHQYLSELQRAQDFGVSVESTGLSDEQIQSIPLCTVESAADRTCSICLSDLAADAEVRSIPCGHIFHQECLDPWLKIRDTCPNCVRRVADSSDYLLGEEV